MPRTHNAHTAPCVKWRKLALYYAQNSLCTCGAMCKMAATHCTMRGTNSLCTCGAMCKIAATHCTMRRPHYAHVAPCVKCRQIVVPHAELTMYMERHVLNRCNSLYHAQNSQCTCGAMCKMAATHCATRKTWFQSCRPGRLLGPGGILHTNKTSLSLNRTKIRYSTVELSLALLLHRCVLWERL
jgi:hypothetical protein